MQLRLTLSQRRGATVPTHEFEFQIHQKEKARMAIVAPSHLVRNAFLDNDLRQDYFFASGVSVLRVAFSAFRLAIMS